MQTLYATLLLKWVFFSSVCVNSRTSFDRSCTKARGKLRTNVMNCTSQVNELILCNLFWIKKFACNYQKKSAMHGRLCVSRRNEYYVFKNRLFSSLLSYLSLLKNWLVLQLSKGNEKFVENEINIIMKCNYCNCSRRIA